MSIQIPAWLKIQPNKKPRLIIAITVLLLLLIVGGVLFQVNPLLRQQVLCPFCSTTPPDIYVTSHTGQTGTTNAFASQTFLYSINARTGKAKYLSDLHKTGETYYQKIINGVSYEIFGNGHGSAPGDNDSLVVTRLSNGKILWNKSLGNVEFQSAITTSTVMYLYVTAQYNAPASLTTITAINLQDGRALWSFEPQDTARMLLDGDILYVGQSGNTTPGLAEQVFALHAKDGSTAWSYPFNNSFASYLNPISDSGHLFFINEGSQKPYYTLVELDENSGSLIRQKQLDTISNFYALFISNHTLLLESPLQDQAQNVPEVQALRDSDMSLLWTSSLKAASEVQSPDVVWNYSPDIIYSRSKEVDPKTFATENVLRAWQISSGKLLFQVNIGIIGKAYILRTQDTLILSSTNGFGAMADPMHNDIEARQAQTGALLWHVHLGKLPAKETQINFYAIDIDAMQQDEFGDTVYYRPDEGRPDPSILYIMEAGDGNKLYALNAQTGHPLWQVDTDALNIDAHIHLLTEFSTSFNSYPRGMVLGPDGNLWFTEFSNPAQIGRITPSGTVTEFPLPAPDSAPDGITNGPDGNLWFTEVGTGGQGRIGSITTSGTITEFPINGIPSQITTGPDGNLWFTEASQELIARMTPTGTVTPFPLPPSTTLFRTPLGITAGPDGNLWFTESGPGGQVGRITTSGTITEFAVPPPDTGRSRGALSITKGRDGNLWFIEANFDTTTPGGNMIVRITPSGILTEFALPSDQGPLFSGPATITMGHDGNLWFTESAANRLVRMTPTGALTYFPLPTDTSGLAGLTSGRDGTLWFTESNQNLLGRLNLPATSTPATDRARTTPVPISAPTPVVTPAPATFTTFNGDGFLLDYPNGWGQIQNGNNYSFTRNDRSLTQFIVGLHNQDQSPDMMINDLTGSTLPCSPQDPPIPASITVNAITWQQSGWSCLLAHQVYVAHVLTSTDSQTNDTTVIVYGSWQVVADANLVDFTQADTLYFQHMLQSFKHS